MPKTGTSSIQASLKGFADSEWVWFKEELRRPNHGVAFGDIVAAAANGEQTRGKSQNVRTFNRLVQSPHQRTLLMSSEGILKYSIDDLRSFHGHATRQGLDDLKVVAYVRPPVGFFTSLARAKMGGHFVGVRLKNGIRYRERFEKLDLVFGRDNVRLWKFDPKTLVNGCVVQDFCGKIGIKFPAEKVIRENESLSREAVGLFYIYRKVGGPDVHKLMKRAPRRLRLVNQLSRIGHKKFRFAPDAIAPLLELDRADIEWMEARLGQSLAEPLGDPQPDDVRSEEDLLRPDPRTIDELRALLGTSAPPGVRGETPEEIAQLVGALAKLDAPGPKKRRSALKWPLARRPSRPRSNGDRRPAERRGFIGSVVERLKRT